MDMAIIEAVLALVVLYLVMSLLASQVNEYLATMLGRRAGTGEDLVTETFPGDDKKVGEFYQYAPIYSLSKGAGRPSAIPPEVFAQAWLAVLNSSKPPRASYRSPSEFITALSPNGKQKELLDWLVAGYEADWDRFEERIATWYRDICDRAEGWYKRRTALWLFGISFLFAALLNVDTGYLFRQMLANDEQRIALANIGELINAAQGGASAPASARQLQLPAASPVDRSAAAKKDLADGLRHLNAAMTDPIVRGAGEDQHPAELACLNGRKTQAAYRSNSDAWFPLLIEVRQMMGEAGSAIALGAPRKRMMQTEAESTPEPTSPLASAARAASEVPARAAAQIVDPAASAATLAVPLDSGGVTDRWLTASLCLDRVTMWIDATWAKKLPPSTVKSLDDARAALGRTYQYIEAERRGSVLAQNLRQRFLAHPQSVIDCSTDAAGDRTVFAECLRQTKIRELPLGWPAPMNQICVVDTVPADKVLKQDGSCPDLPADDSLGIRALEGSWKGWTSLVSIFIGWLLTAIMVSLGAPFWFGVLGKVANLRLAGRVRGGESGDVAGGDRGPSSGQSLGPFAPKSSTAASAPAQVPIVTAQGIAIPSAPFSDARNTFEQTLRLQDITRLQKALDLPPTGRLDQLTRQRIKEALGTEEELSPTSFELITGRRAPVVVVPTTGGPAIWTRGYQAGPEAGTLAKALNTLLPALPKLNEAEEYFDDDIRARVVLFRLLSDQGKPWAEREVVTSANSRDGSLNGLNEATRKAIATATTPLSLSEPGAPLWIYTALGELGVTEQPGQAQSDPRVVEYIRAIGSEAMAHDETPWCGAFAGWVMSRAGLLDKNYASPKPELMQAAKWANFGESTTFNNARIGDICVIARPGGLHVAFFIAKTSVAGGAYLLGGNQGSAPLSGSVTLVPWRDADQATFRRPRA